MINGKKKKGFHIMRQVRLKLKTGFIKSEPEDYTFMKRYPPLSRDTAPKFQETKRKIIPYLSLYEKAVERNVLYNDELVYPAYWNQEPQALTLAKKQYELIQKGMDEESAYQEAIAHVDVIENESFLDMEKVAKTLNTMGARAPFLSDPAIAKDIVTLRRMMAGLTYEELDLAEQGEIDFVIQTKVLKWNEVERERRMKDPIFVRHFEKIRNSLFPTDEMGMRTQREMELEEKRSEFLFKNNLDEEKLTTNAPFFVEDYIEHFVRMKAQPDLRRWTSDDRAELSRWVVDCLAIKLEVENGDLGAQTYLNNLRSHFFPMIPFPGREFEVPTVESIKRALYQNDVGYLPTEEGLWVQRFYRLPMLLFPRETIASSRHSEEEQLQQRVRKEETLSAQDFGEVSSAQLTEMLGPLLKDSGLEMPDYSRSPAQIGDSSVRVEEDIDDILSDARRESKEEERYNKRLAEKQRGLVPDVLADLNLSSVEDAEDDRGSDADLSDLDDDEVAKQSTRKKLGEEKWSAVLQKYYKVPKTQLQLEREQFFRASEYSDVEELEEVGELEAFKEQRLTDEVVVRARLLRQYEDKEAARRVKDWESRGVWVDEMPRPTMKMFSSRLAGAAPAP